MTSTEYREHLFRQHATSWEALSYWAKQIDKMILWMVALLAAVFALYQDTVAILLPFVSSASVLWFVLYRRASSFYKLNKNYVSIIRDRICEVDGFNSYLYGRIHKEVSPIRYTVYEGLFLAVCALTAINLLAVFMFLLMYLKGDVYGAELWISIGIGMLNAAGLLYLTQVESYEFSIDDLLVAQASADIKMLRKRERAHQANGLLNTEP